MTALTVGQTSQIISGEWVEVVRASSEFATEYFGSSDFPELKREVERPTLQLLRGLVEMTPAEARDSPITRLSTDWSLKVVKERVPVWHISHVQLMSEANDGSVVEQPYQDLLLSPEKQDFVLNRIEAPESYKLPSIMIADAIYSL